MLPSSFFFFLTRHDFFWIWFLFFNKLGDCLFFFFFLGCLSLFCFNWSSFFNKGCMSKFIQTHFFHPSIFPLPTKQKGKKLKFFLSSHYFIFSHFSTPPTKWTLRVLVLDVFVFTKCCFSLAWCSQVKKILIKCPTPFQVILHLHLHWSWMMRNSFLS